MRLVQGPNFALRSNCLRTLWLSSTDKRKAQSELVYQCEQTCLRAHLLLRLVGLVNSLRCQPVWSSPLSRTLTCWPACSVCILPTDDEKPYLTSVLVFHMTASTPAFTRKLCSCGELLHLSGKPWNFLASSLLRVLSVGCRQIQQMNVRNQLATTVDQPLCNSCS